MKVIVITGSTRGIGYGLAEEFLERGCAVLINGRSQESVAQAVEQLSANYNAEKIEGYACDVRDYKQVLRLWDAAIAGFDKVDYWINNAGVNTARSKFYEASPDNLRMTLDINLTGTINGSHVAINGMLKQGAGQIFNMLGHGSSGRKQAGLTTYGTSKYGLKYLTDALILEMKDTAVKIGSLSPGMVITDLLMSEFDKDSDEWKEVKGIFNILADHVETVSPFLVDKLLANEKNGAEIKWLTTTKMIWRFLSAPISRRNLFD